MEEYRREVELRLCSQVKYKIGWFIRAENVLPLSNTAGYDTAKTILTFVEDNIQMRLLNTYNIYVGMFITTFLGHLKALIQYLSEVEDSL